MTLARRAGRVQAKRLKYIIGKISNVFFTFNHRNYARWLTFYHDSLLNLDELYPGLKDQLLIGVKRTDKPFSRVPVDMTLEQTINAESGRRLTGIAHLSNSISARQRWSFNHAVRCTLISHILSECRLNTTRDISIDLLKNQIDQSDSQIDKFIVTIKN